MPKSINYSMVLLIPCLSIYQAAHAEDEPAFTPLWDVTWKDSNQWVEAVSRRPMLIDKAPQAVVVLDEEELNNTPAYDIASRLRYEAGIDVYQSRAGQIDIGLRGYAGLNSPRTVAVMDGREFNFDLFGTPLWVGALHPTDIIRAEIVKGPSSVSYGANAFGGVISLSDRNVGDFTELHTLVQMGENGHYEFDATSMGPLGHLNGPGPMYFKFSAGATQREDLDGLRGLEPGEPFPRAIQNDEDSMVSNRVSLLLGTKLTHDYQLELEFYRLNIQSWDMIEDLAVGSNDINMEQDTLGLRLIAPWGEVRYLHSNTDEFYSNSITSYTSTSDYRYTQGDLKSVQDQFRFQYTQNINTNHFLSYGIDYLRWESFSNFWSKDAQVDDPSTWATVVTTNKAAFIEDQWEVSDAWTVSSAIRVDDHNIIGVNASPRLAANYQIDDDEFLRLSYSQGYRLPAPLEGYLDQYFYNISDDLDEETINSINLGWQKSWERKYQLSIDVFFNRSEDTPFWVPVDEAEMQQNWDDWLTYIGDTGDFTRAPGPFFNYENTDNPATVMGAELSSNIDISGNEYDANLWMNITYQDFHFENDIIYQSDGFPDGTVPSGQAFQFNQNLGDDINGPPDWKISVGGNWDYQGWQLSSAVRYVSGREVFSFASSQWRTRDLASRDTLDGYTVLDVAAAYNWGHDTSYKRILKLSILNLFDDEHTEIYEVTVDELVDSGENQHTNEIGRSAVLSFIWEF